MKITDETIDRISRLARLTLSREEKETAAAQLEEIVSYMEILGRLDIDGVESMSHEAPVKNVLREDVAAPSEERESLLKNAPAHDGETFLAPKTVE